MNIDTMAFARAAVEVRVEGSPTKGYHVPGPPGQEHVLQWVSGPDTTIVLPGNTQTPFPHPGPAWELYLEEAINFVAFQNLLIGYQDNRRANTAAAIREQFGAVARENTQ